MSATALFESVAPPEALASDLCWLLSRANQLQKAEFDTALTATGLTSRKHQVLAIALGVTVVFDLLFSQLLGVPVPTGLLPF